MIEVSLLGRVSVAVDGVPLTGEAAQRRRLALLALLSVPTPRPLSRDRAMLFLWPDGDSASARHLLSVAVHVLRRSLGHEALLTTPDEIALAAGAVRVDVAAFEEALRRGEHEEAIRLYGGPFMDGFHAGAGPELEQWIDTERTRLERSYAQALEGAAAARRAAGDLAGAAEAWRKRVLIDPYSARGALGLMQALAEAGDRAAAIRHASVHRQLLDAELGAAADAEVEALAERLRAEATTQAQPATPGAGDVARAAAAPVPAQASGSGDVVAQAAPATAAGPEAQASSVPTVPPGPPLAPARAVPPPRPGSFPRRLARRWREAALAVLLLALVAFVGERWRSGTRATPPPRTLVVLPCDNTSAHAATDDIGASIADDIREALWGMGGLQMIARTSSMAMRGKNLTVPEIGTVLGADLVLECSVRLVGERVEVKAALVDGHDGAPRWHDRWEGQSGEIFEIREKMARGVAKVLRVSLDPGALAGSTDSLAAFRYYSAAQQAWYERTPRSLERAALYYDSALAADPAYARAYAGLALTLIVQGSYDYGSLAPDSAFPRAEQVARKARELAPGLGQAHLALAGVYMNYDWRLSEAEKEFRLAIEADPGSSTARQWYALLLIAQKRFDEARTQMLRSGETESSAPQHVQLAHFFYYNHQYDLTLQEAGRALEIDAAFPRAYMLKAMALIQLGHPDSAAAILETLRRRAQEPAILALLAYAHAKAGHLVEARSWLAGLQQIRRERYVPAELLALVHVGLGDKARAQDELERAFAQHSNGMIYLGVEPAMEPLRAEPRFLKLVQNVAAGRPPTPRTFLTRVRALP